MKQSLQNNSEATFAQVYTCAINIITRRDHALAELKQKLNQRDFPAELINQAITRCSEQGYLDDQRYASSFIRAKINKGHGLNRIRNEIRFKGVSEHDLNTALAELEPDWFEQAKLSYQKKFKGSEVGDYKDRQKRQRFLFQRGFDGEQVRYAMSSVESN
ncbi:regulatory protein RecX [Motilimonas pumila]|nr:regulatory protein RecX [Motilimonas pumila]